MSPEGGPGDGDPPQGGDSKNSQPKDSKIKPYERGKYDGKSALGKVGTFLENSVKSIANSVIDASNYASDLDQVDYENGGFGSASFNKIGNDISDIASGVKNYLTETSLSQMGSDLSDKLSSVETYENLVGGIITTKGVGTLSKARNLGSIGKAEGLTKASLGNISGILRSAAKGKGNFGLGTGTYKEAMFAGEAWVGKGYKIASDGRTMVSSNGLRQFRPPTHKPRLGRMQANFEWRNAGQKQWQGNGHLNIK